MTKRALERVAWMTAAAVALPLALQLNGNLGTARASELPFNQQALLMFRILAYDRNLKTRAGADVGVFLVYQPGDPGSERARVGMEKAFTEAAKTFKVVSLPIRVIPAAVDALLGGKLDSTAAAAAYLCAGLSDKIPQIAAVARHRSLLTVTATETDVSAGASIGLVDRSGKPTVMVNLGTAKAEGTDLDSSLLQLAEVVR